MNSRSGQLFEKTADLPINYPKKEKTSIKTNEYFNGNNRVKAVIKLTRRDKPLKVMLLVVPVLDQADCDDAKSDTFPNVRIRW